LIVIFCVKLTCNRLVTDALIHFGISADLRLSKDKTKAELSKRQQPLVAAFLLLRLSLTR